MALSRHLESGGDKQYGGVDENGRTDLHRSLSCGLVTKAVPPSTRRPGRPQEAMWCACAVATGRTSIRPQGNPESGCQPSQGHPAVRARAEPGPVLARAERAIEGRRGVETRRGREEIGRASCRERV